MSAKTLPSGSLDITGRRSGASEPQFACFASPPAFASAQGRTGRGAAQRTLDRCPDCARHRPEPAHRQPHREAVEAKPSASSNLRPWWCATSTLPRRPAAHGHQAPGAVSAAFVAYQPQPSRQGRRHRVESVHIAIDDDSRLAFAAIYPDKKRASVLHSCTPARRNRLLQAQGTFKAVIAEDDGSYRFYAPARRNEGARHQAPPYQVLKALAQSRHQPQPTSSRIGLDQNNRSNFHVRDGWDGGRVVHWHCLERSFSGAVLSVEALRDAEPFSTDSVRG